MIKKKLKILELFGGIGAPRKALENLNLDIKTIDYVEIYDYAVLAYNSMFCNNYKTQDIQEWNQNVDIVIHGSPCQDFSTAGKHAGIYGERSGLVLETLRIIEEMKTKPGIVIWENVKGILSKKHIEALNYYIKEMERMGYKNTYKILNSKEFGIPQSRERVFVVSIFNKSKYSFSFDNLETKTMRPLNDFLEPEQDIHDYYILNQKSMIKAIENKKCKILNKNKHCMTITLKQDRWNNAGVIEMENKRPIPYIERGNDPNYKYIWKNQYRQLTELECWRLMGFTDRDFNAVKNNGVSKVGLYSLAGNSIVVPVMEAIFKELLKDEIKQK